jgi:hypothetical protein
MKWIEQLWKLCNLITYFHFDTILRFLGYFKLQINKFIFYFFGGKLRFDLSYNDVSTLKFYFCRRVVQTEVKFSFFKVFFKKEKDKSFHKWWNLSELFFWSPHSWKIGKIIIAIEWMIFAFTRSAFHPIFFVTFSSSKLENS